jgi:hypothetical protein
MEFYPVDAGTIDHRSKTGGLKLVSPDVRLIALLLLVLPSWAQAADGDWPMWRHDSLLTAYQPLPGRMTEAPRVLAKHVIGASRGATTFADLLGTGKDTEVLVIARGRLLAHAESGKQLWNYTPQGYILSQIEWIEDLDGDGHREVIALAGHIGGTRLAYLILDGATWRQEALIEISTGDIRSYQSDCACFGPVIAS